MTPAPTVPAKLSRVMQPFLLPLLVIAGYLIVQAALARATAARGLLAPWGSLHVPAVVLGLIVLAWKLVAIFVVPAWLVYRLLDMGLDRLLRRSK